MNHRELKEYFNIDDILPRSIVDEIEKERIKKMLNACCGNRNAYPKVKKVSMRKGIDI